MTKHSENEISFKSPTILNGSAIMEMRNEFLTTNCKFNGTCNLDLYEDYIEWLAHTLNQTHSTEWANFNNALKHTYIVNSKHDGFVGMAEIILYVATNPVCVKAHIITCIRPSSRRKGYTKIIRKKAIQQCTSFGVDKANISFERNSKASNGTMNKIMNF